MFLTSNNWDIGLVLDIASANNFPVSHGHLNLTAIVQHSDTIHSKWLWYWTINHFIEAILAKIEEAGFQVAMSKELTLTPEQAAEFYKELEGKDFYESLCAHMSSGPVMVLCLARENAVQVWRDMLGPPQVEDAKDEAPES